MFLVYVILVLFSILAVLCLVEDKIPTIIKTIIYIIVGMILIGVATFREIGFDPDSLTYEGYYYSSPQSIEDAVEYSYIWICSMCKDVRVVFFIYALLGVALKLIAFPRLGNKENMLLMLVAYLSYTFELHETTQIRTGVLAGCFLLAIPYMANRNILKAVLLLTIGTFFHTTGLALFPLLFLSNKPFTRMTAWVWISLIPISMILSMVNIQFDFIPNLEYIGNKLENYQTSDPYSELAYVNVFSPLHLISICIAFYLMAFHKRLTQENPYFPYLLKIYILALSTYAFFSFFPIIGDRICHLYEVVWIPLLPLLSYTITPRGIGKLVSIGVCFILLNYMLRSMYNFVIFLKPL